MQTGIVFLVEIFITVLITALVLVYLRPFLKRILVDLCGTEERAQFWTTFANIVLLSLPLLAALGFTPTAATAANAAVEIAHRLKTNLTFFLLGLIFIGFVLLIFSAAAPRAVKRAEQPGSQK